MTRWCLVALPELGTARLRLSLDLLEMLELIKSGYRPSPADLQGLFVNLLIFRNELLSLPFDRIMVTKDDAAFHVISAATGSDGDIRLKLGLADHGVAGAKAMGSRCPSVKLDPVPTRSSATRRSSIPTPRTSTWIAS